MTEYRDYITNLHLEMLKDIRECLAVFLKSPGVDLTQEPANWVASVFLPLQSNVLQFPGATSISSVEEKKTLYLSLQEVQAIETYARDNHRNKDVALLELIRLSMRDHKHLGTITGLLRQRSTKDVQVTLEFELVGEMEWNERHTNNTAA